VPPREFHAHRVKILRGRALEGSGNPVFRRFSRNFLRGIGIAKDFSELD
jgi:hypothetical protein